MLGATIYATAPYIDDKVTAFDERPDKIALWHMDAAA